MNPTSKMATVIDGRTGPPAPGLHVGARHRYSSADITHGPQALKTHT